MESDMSDFPDMSDLSSFYRNNRNVRFQVDLEKSILGKNFCRGFYARARARTHVRIIYARGALVNIRILLWGRAAQKSGS